MGTLPEKTPVILKRLEEFNQWGDDILRRGLHGDPEALCWFAFANLSLVSLVVMIVVAVLISLF